MKFGQNPKIEFIATDYELNIKKFRPGIGVFREIFCQRLFCNFAGLAIKIIEECFLSHFM